MFRFKFQIWLLAQQRWNSDRNGWKAPSSE